jgi:hypothetical protein
MSTALIILIVVVGILIILGIFYMLQSIFTSKVLHNNLGYLARLVSLLLILQYILGMISNLYQNIPTQQPYNVFHIFGPILLHVINGTFILVFSVIFLRLALKTHESVKTGIIGLIAVWTAYICGEVFVNLGQNNWFSLGMSLAFLLAFIAYGSRSYKEFMMHK